MSTMRIPSSDGFLLERAMIALGRLLVRWGESRERLERERQELYRRQTAAVEDQAVRAAAVRSGLLH